VFALLSPSGRRDRRRPAAIVATRAVVTRPTIGPTSAIPTTGAIAATRALTSIMLTATAALASALARLGDRSARAGHDAHPIGPRADPEEAA
jgi:hypothetical protein